MAEKVQFLMNPAALVDEIGQLKAEIAPLKKRLDMLSDVLKSKGDGNYAGALYDANVATSIRSLLDMDAVRAKLSPQFMAAHSTESESIILRVTAKKLTKIAA